MISINEDTISSIDGSLNNYEENIDNVTSIMNKNNDYSSVIYEDVSKTSESQTDVSLFLKDLTFSDSVDDEKIVNMSNSYNKFYDDLKKSKKINSELKNEIEKYETIEARLKNAQKTNTYFNLMVWGIIFSFVVVTLFFSIIEDRKEMNIFSRIMLLIFLLVVIFNIAKNFGVYIERNV